jgi:hypothetical protein
VWGKSEGRRPLTVVYRKLLPVRIGGCVSNVGFAPDHSCEASRACRPSKFHQEAPAEGVNLDEGPWVDRPTGVEIVTCGGESPATQPEERVGRLSKSAHGVEYTNP